MTPSDPFLTFDLVNMVDLFSWLINPNRMQQTRFKSEHVLTFTSVKFNDPSDPIWHVTFNRWRPYMGMDPRNLLTNYEGHESFPLRQDAF